MTYYSSSFRSGQPPMRGRRRAEQIARAVFIGCAIAVMQAAVAQPIKRALSAAEEQALRPKDEFQECDVCPRMVVVPAGQFNMGAPPEDIAELKRQFPGRDYIDWQGPMHAVVIARPFAVGKFEVTFAEWEACVADGGCQSNRSPKDWDYGRGNRPVISVTWRDSKEYVAWLSRKTGKGYRLLTEAEWEYAARAGAQTRYHFGDDPGELGKYEWSFENANKRTQPVGQKQANAFGLHDMLGNVREWVEDCFVDNYNGAPTDGTAWTSGDCSQRVVRGGFWFTVAVWLRSATRIGLKAGPGLWDTGLRVARSL